MGFFTPCKRFGSWSLVVICLTVSSANAALSRAERAKWMKISSGKHSFRKLGKEFYVELPVRIVPDARLVYFNEDLARRLGLPIPEDPRELEELMLSLFAVEIDPTGESKRTMIATRYLDSEKVAPGEALGDGRAVWAGELQIPMADGRMLSVDLVAKGVGKTPLAWESHPDPNKNNGVQWTRELARSPIISRANVNNELDSTDDLAGFAFGNSGRTSVIRAGNQTRVAHFAYFSGDPAKFRRIFEYVVRRDLGYPSTWIITPKEIREYFDTFIKNMADETARYDDLDMIHGAPTNGNRTTKGSTIDLLEVWYQDANHQNLPYLFDWHIRHDQYFVMRRYAECIIAYMKHAHYPVPRGLNVKYVNHQFDVAYGTRAIDLGLARLGIPAQERPLLTKDTRQRFLQALFELRWAVSTENRKVYGEWIYPAVFDVRAVLRNTFASWNLPKSIALIFNHSRPWATILTSAHRDLEYNYLNVVETIVEELTVSRDFRDDWVANAQRFGRRIRDSSETPSAKPGDPFYDRHDARIIRAIEEGSLNYREIGDLIKQAADEITDVGLTPRGMTNLGLSPGAKAESTASRPPIHTEICQRLSRSAAD